MNEFSNYKILLNSKTPESYIFEPYAYEENWLWTKKTHNYSMGNHSETYSSDWTLAFGYVPQNKAMIKFENQWINLKENCFILIPPFKIIQFKTFEFQITWNVVSFNTKPVNTIEEPIFINNYLHPLPKNKLELNEFLREISTCKGQIIFENQNLSSTKFRKKIVETFKTSMNLQDISQNYYSSRVIASRDFRSNYGMSPILYRHKTRIFEALKLVRLGFKITDAIFEVGFNDPSQFNRIFKQIFNVEPYKFKPIQNSTAQIQF